MLYVIHAHGDSARKHMQSIEGSVCYRTVYCAVNAMSLCITTSA